MKVGDLVRVVKEDMSLVIKVHGQKDNLFFGKVGTIIKLYDPAKWEVANPWYDVLFSAGLYQAREDALEVISESR